MIQQSNGKFVVLGFTTPSPGSGSGLIPYRFFFARFNADGTLDATFGTGGTTVVRFGSASILSLDLVQEPDGKLVAVGSVALQSGGSDVGIVRLTPDGALDPLFDGDGKRTVDVDGNYDSAYAVAVQPDNTIVVAGSTDWDRALLLRVNADGSLDSNFHPAIVPDIYLRSIVAQADGKLAATGERHTGRRYINRFHKIQTAFDMILVRFESDGALDTAFGTDGVATADFGERNIPPNSSGVALIQQFDGRYVAVARNSIGSFGAARFDDDAEFPGFIGLAASLTDQRVSDVTASVVTYTVRRTGGMTGAVSVEYATSPGSAEPGSDFESRSGTLTWADGDASDKTVEVSIINDTLAEVDEDFSLTLSAPTGGAQLAATDTATTIVSGDVYGIVGLERSAETIAESVGSVTFTVLRTGSASGAVRVYYATSSGSAIADSDFTSVSGTLSWADGDTTVRTITLNLTNDSTDESDETFTFTLSNPSGSAVLGSYFQATVTIVDDDSPAPLPAGLGFTLANASVGEASGVVVLNVSRSGGASGAVSVSYATSSGSAIAESDFASASGTLTWADGDTAVKTITVNMTNDSTDESDETLTVTLSNPSSGAALGSTFRATVTIVDDDSPAPPPPPPPTPTPSRGNSGGGALGFLSLLLLGIARFVRRPCQGVQLHWIPTADGLLRRRVSTETTC